MFPVFQRVEEENAGSRLPERHREIIWGQCAGSGTVTSYLTLLTVVVLLLMRLCLFQSVKNPKTVYRYLQLLLGKKLDNPQVALYQKRFPEHQLQEDPQRQTVSFKYSEYDFVSMLNQLLKHLYIK